MNRTGGKWKRPPHIQLIDETLFKVATGEIKRLMVFMPPRHGKSEMISKHFAAWQIAVDPDKRVILTSYEADFAASWGRKARNWLEEWGTDLGVTIASDSSAANRWEVDGHTGGMVTAGVGGPITGRGCNVLIIDDPVKNYEEASSQTMRDKVWDWYKSTAYTRLEPGGAVILIMTRWHEDDLAGRLLVEEASGGDKWVKLILPAVAEDEDMLGREIGQALWPERFDEKRLTEIRKTLGSYMFSSLYQQRPQPAETALFKRMHFRYAKKVGNEYVLQYPDRPAKRVPIAACWRFQTVDPSGKEKETADYFVIQTFDVTPDNELILIGITRERSDTVNHIAMMEAAWREFEPDYQCVESQSYGLNIFQTLKRRGWAIRELIADKDKVNRARPASVFFENEMFFILDGVEHQDEYEKELLSFPKGKHDDMVDTTAYGVIEVEEQGHGPRMREL